MEKKINNKKVMLLAGLLIVCFGVTGIASLYSRIHIAKATGKVKSMAYGILTDHTLYGRKEATQVNQGTIIWNPPQSPQHPNSQKGDSIVGKKFSFHDGVSYKGFAFCVESGVGSGFTYSANYKDVTVSTTPYTYKRSVEASSSPTYKKAGAWLSWLESTNTEEEQQLEWVAQLGVWACLGQVKLYNNEIGKVYDKFNALYTSDPNNEAFRHKITFHEYDSRRAGERVQKLVTFSIELVDKGSLTLIKEAVSK